MECVGCQKTERRLAFSGDKKPGNFYSDPWTARPGGGMMVGRWMSARSISSSSAMDLVAESQSVLSTACSPLSRLAWPRRASANGGRSPSRDAFQRPPRAHWASRRSSTVTDWPPPCWPRNSRPHRQAFGTSSAAGGCVSRHNSPFCSTTCARPRSSRPT